ncbi:MAG: DUF3109 family protein [Saprospiraceae bacterium]|nr:DUF3109 family protein [Saprospiraceae bacterium]
MILIQEKILVSLDVIEEQFLCNLDACKGACCWEGDSGAPLETEELETLDNIYETIKPYLRPEGIAAIEAQGKYVFTDEGNYKEYSTPLVDNAACAYMTIDKQGIAKCGIEEAYLDKKVDFKKPISCHLYPIRISEFDGVDAVNYERWDICSAACTAGKKAKLPVYQFLKEPFIRKYGEAAYEELDEVAKDWKQMNG